MKEFKIGYLFVRFLHKTNLKSQVGFSFFQKCAVLLVCALQMWRLLCVGVDPLYYVCTSHH